MKLNLRVLSNVVIIYMLCAFSWWSALLYIKNKDAYTAKSEYMKLVLIAQGTVKDEADFKIFPDFLKLKEKYQRQEWMILGEASLFIFSLVFGIWLINRGHRVEVAAEQQTRNFLLSITHELKSPLASIRLSLETMLRRDLPKDARDTLSKNAIKETDRLTDLVKDLLFASKVETFYQPFLEELDVQELMSDIIHDFEERNVAVQVEFICPDHPIFLKGDRQGLTSVFENLLSNSLKYSFENPKINVMLAEKDHKIFISFADQGIGIPDAEKKKVFDKFYRVGNEDTRKAKGTGLGLYIVQEVIKAHLGKITVSDNSPKGSVFKVVLSKIKD